MERPKNLKQVIAITIIILFNLVGLIGLVAPLTRTWFLQFVPYHLLLMMVVVVSVHRGGGKQLAVFMLLIIVAGFGAEWIGVHTGLLFGNYQYGGTLSPKVSGVPLIIGVNWFLLIYCMGVFMQRSRVKKRWPRIIIGAVGLVLLDLLIEPTANRLNYWHWADTQIHYKNYICWFILSAVFLYVFERVNFKRQSIVAEVLLIAQFVFFAVLFV